MLPNVERSDQRRRRPTRQTSASPEPNAMRRRPLNSGWQSRQLDPADYPQAQLTLPGWFPAQVPGHVHTDLVANHILPDPLVGLHELGCQWVDTARWAYRTEFEWHAEPDLPRRVLRFQGLDTVCRVLLNGAPLAEHDNMFVPLEVDVTERLERGRNELLVEFDSAVHAGLERRRAYFEREGLPWTTPWFDERAFVRKVQSMSGWDWGPRLVSCGVWRPVELLEFQGRIQEASFLQEKLPNGKFRVWADVQTEGEGDLRVELAGQVRQGGQDLEFELEPDLWWPAGEGPQTLHPARVALSTGDEVHKRVGLRTIRLVQDLDAHGRSFEFEVNGRPIYARGANWIPDDSMVARVDDQDVARRIARLPKLGFNMLRVWGGGLYESESFYDACDEHGMLVWQDFPYACMHYPDDEATRERAYAEASHHVRRLRDRASLALWCGNNENEVMYLHGWGGSEHRPPRLYGLSIYHQTLPSAVRDHDPSTCYLRTSPVGIEVEDPLLSERAERFGDSHYWNVWHGGGDWRVYADSEARFSSEYGFGSSPSLATWRDTLLGTAESPENPIVQWHDKTMKGLLFREYVEMHYPPSQTLEDWVYTSQLNQRDAIRYGVEAFRRSPYCRGSLIWQLNDCWPVNSWALEDYRRLLKPAGQELARLYAPTTLSVFVKGEVAELWLIHDGPTRVDKPVRYAAVDTVTGVASDAGEARLSVEPGERRCFKRIDLSPYACDRTALRVEFDGEPASVRWELLAHPKSMQLGAPRLSVCEHAGALEVSVEGFVADLVVWDDERPEAVLSPWTELPGWTALTLAQESIRVPLDGSVGRLRLRSLLGGHPV